MQAIALRIDPADNIGIAVRDINAGDSVRAGDQVVTATAALPQGHKIALSDVPCGGDVIKYGVVIGRASRKIRAGDWVHTHNLEDITEELCEKYAAQYRERAGVQ